MDFGLKKVNGIWHYAFYVNNNRYRKSTKTSTKELAILYTQKVYNEIYQGIHKLRNNIKVKLDDLIQEYISINKKNFSKDWLEYKQRRKTCYRKR